MTFTRFLTLFVVYALSILIGMFATERLKDPTFKQRFLLSTVIGFLVLAIPLTILTLLK